MRNVLSHPIALLVLVHEVNSIGRLFHPSYYDQLVAGTEQRDRFDEIELIALGNPLRRKSARKVWNNG